MSETMDTYSEIPAVSARLGAPAGKPLHREHRIPPMHPLASDLQPCSTGGCLLCVLYTCTGMYRAKTASSLLRNTETYEWKNNNSIHVQPQAQGTGTGRKPPRSPPHPDCSNHPRLADWSTNQAEKPRSMYMYMHCTHTEYIPMYIPTHSAHSVHVPRQ